MCFLRRPTYIAVRNMNIERAAMKKQQCVLYSAVDKLTHFLHVYASSAVLTASYHFTRRERFYGDFSVVGKNKMSSRPHAVSDVIVRY
jgi:hypothetical protein